jgi:MtN3 and saliva related transmembrane protein
MNQPMVIGIIASIFSATALLPQLIKLIRDKKPQEVSSGMLLILFVGLAFWIYYGTLISDWIIIISNSFSLLVNLTIGILAILYSKKSILNNP